MNSSQRAPWKLPRGVSRGLWEYALAPHIARDYDDCFSYNKLFQLDQQVLQRYFDPGPRPGSKVVVDLGCGTGRALCPLVTRGFRGIAVDLSPHMLRVVREKSQHDQLPIDCVRANLVDLDCLADASADYAISLFSTLGMIRGSENRFQSVRHTARILKPGGLFVGSLGATVDPGSLDADWLGVEMYFSGLGQEANRTLFNRAGFTIERESLETTQEFGRPVSFHWIVAQKPQR
jgi:SAM-dependent methyltransferase